MTTSPANRTKYLPQIFALLYVRHRTELAKAMIYIQSAAHVGKTNHPIGVLARFQKEGKQWSVMVDR
jgi:hypothetical protein